MNATEHRVLGTDALVRLEALAVAQGLDGFLGQSTPEELDEDGIHLLSGFLRADGRSVRCKLTMSMRGVARRARREPVDVPYAAFAALAVPREEFVCHEDTTLRARYPCIPTINGESTRAALLAERWAI